jgi:predicted DCC family thiol-disulfide oxidoreductase YuxK
MPDDRISSDRPAASGPTVFFDGSCPLCRAEIDLYRRQDGEGRLCFVDVAAPDAPLDPRLTPDAAMARFHVREADGTLRSGADAFVTLWGAVPAWRWAAKLGRLPGVTPLLELAYRGFLPVRPFLSRAVARWQRRRVRA